MEPIWDPYKTHMGSIWVAYMEPIWKPFAKAIWPYGFLNNNKRRKKEEKKVYICFTVVLFYFNFPSKKFIVGTFSFSK